MNCYFGEGRKNLFGNDLTYPFPANSLYRFWSTAQCSSGIDNIIFKVNVFTLKTERLSTTKTAVNRQIKE